MSRWSVTLCRGGYINLITRGKPLPQEGIAKIKREVNDFHSERMNSPPQTSSLKYWAQASLKYPILAQDAQKYLCIPASSATSKHSFSKVGIATLSTLRIWEMRNFPPYLRARRFVFSFFRALLGSGQWHTLLGALHCQHSTKACA